MNKEERISFNREYWLFLLSSILISLSACLGNVVDGIIVGNLIGEDGLSAINFTRPVTQFMFTLSMLVATGASMLVGMEIGKKDMNRAAYIFTLSMGASLGIGLILTILGLIAPESVTGLLCDDEQLFASTRDYLFPMLLGAPAYMISWALASMVGVDGSPRLVSIAILIDNAVNLSLDIVFIGWLGWGIEGSSAATVIGHIVGIVIMCRHFSYPAHHLRLNYEKGQTFTTFGKMLSQGAPLALASISLTVLLFCANRIVLTAVGRTGFFAFSVCMNLLQIYNLFLAGTCRTIQSLGAIQVGKGDSEALGLVLRKSLVFISVAMLATCILVWIGPQMIARFFGADTPESVSTTTSVLPIFALSFVPFCYLYVLMIVYKLYAHHQMALFMSLALSLTVIPVMWIVAKVAPTLFWYSYLIAYAVEALTIFVLHKVWKLKFEIAQ